jgi:hypothetical protein
MLVGDTGAERERCEAARLAGYVPTDLCFPPAR